ncbi:MAG: Hsp33 family molecular chaperone HslO [Synechococcaceae cyanobacterium SM2_3_1]|nr:Hsp33 family molecular chaperone HslO [Synechococcaceae cyanobacterium SM2_3_1]
MITVHPAESCDQLLRATAADGMIRAVGLVSTHTVEEARQRHQLSYVATVALGRTINAALLLAANLKESQARINLQIKGDGPLGKVWVDAGIDGTVRGYVENPAIELPLTEHSKLNVAQAVGRYGYLHVIRDQGYGVPYTSATELVTGEIGDDITRYLAVSEQTPSAVLLGVMVNHEEVMVSGGILLQLLPGASVSLSRELEQRLTLVDEFSPLLAEGQSLEDLLNRYIGDLGLTILPGTQQIRFHCRCSQERVKGALQMLGQQELRTMILEDKGAEATCHFCNQVYHVSEAELEEVLHTMQAASPR